MFTIDFYQSLILAVAGIALGGVALWTWQRKYWEYQLRRQTEDWKLRQCYSRRDSQRVAMEELLVEMNRALEDFVNATWLVASAMKRRNDYVGQGGTEEGIKKWNQEVDKSVAQFNESELEWLAHSRVISGEISLHFNDTTGEFVKLWDKIIHQSEGTCNLFHKQGTTLHEIWNMMQDLRNKKDELLDILQKGIDRFVSEELEYRVVK
ncbi:MAG: hypothetical protein PVF74_10570 [Anaerolineales bacterium]|jgi:hypothetical protein